LELAQISETIEFPKTFVIVGNIALAVWIFFDALGILLINIAWGVAFLIILLLGVYGILKFLGCMRPCYNCKNVPSAWADSPHSTSGSEASKTTKKPTTYP
jgi:hypothetical protein